MRVPDSWLLGRANLLRFGHEEREPSDSGQAIEGLKGKAVHRSPRRQGVRDVTANREQAIDGRGGDQPARAVEEAVDRWQRR